MHIIDKRREVVKQINCIKLHIVANGKTRGEKGDKGGPMQRSRKKGRTAKKWAGSPWISMAARISAPLLGRKEEKTMKNVKCPICGTINYHLYLEETNGWMECERCGNLTCSIADQKMKYIPVLTKQQLREMVRG